MRIAAVQMNVCWGDPQQNLRQMESALKQAVGQGAALIVFPECALTGYCFDSAEEAHRYAEPIPGPSSRRMGDACRRLGVHAAFGLIESDDRELYNACVLVGAEGDEDGLVGGYRKIHLPYLGLDRFTTPGDRPFSVLPAGPLRVGMNICYDGAFPESARLLALAGADLIVLPTNWPPGAECFAEHAINTRAMENHVYCAAVNRVGSERGFRFIGRSSICGVEGETLAAAGPDEETILYADLDPEKPRNKRIVRVPGKHIIDRFADRRPEMYGPIIRPRRA